MFLFTIGLGIFNAISTLVDAIAANLNIKDYDDLIRGMILMGAIIIPSFFGLAFAGEVSVFFLGMFIKESDIKKYFIFIRKIGDFDSIILCIRYKLVIFKVIILNFFSLVVE